MQGAGRRRTNRSGSLGPRGAHTRLGAASRMYMCVGVSGVAGDMMLEEKLARLV